MHYKRAMALVQSVLSKDVLHKDYRRTYNASDPLQGHAYAASEACFSLVGGRVKGWRPMMYQFDETITHWWLEHLNGTICDPTAEQFYGMFPYEKGMSRGFITVNLSNRACVILNRVHKLIGIE